MTKTYTTPANAATPALSREEVREKTDRLIAALPSEISDYIIDDNQPWGRILAHPFYRIVGLETHIASGIDIATPEFIIEHIADRQADYEKTCAVGDFEGALWGVCKAYRANHLLALMDKHGVEKLYPAIGDAWMDAGSMVRDFDLWDEIWGQVIDGDGDCLSVTDVEDRETFNALPDTLTIHRGFRDDGGEYGWSWSLDRAMAEWFGRRFSSNGKVATIIIPKCAVLAYFNGRNESEIVIHPDVLNEDKIEIETVGPELDLDAA